MFDTKQHIIFLSAIIILSIVPMLSHAQRTKSSLNAGEQRFSEKGLKDNRYFFYFIDSSISNMGNDKENMESDKEKALYKEAIQRDIIAQQMYMKFQFHNAYVEIRRAQKLLIDVYRLSLQREIRTTKKLLDGFAPQVIKMEERKSRHYLRLGYRDVTAAKIDLLMADNYKENLYSLRLYKYVHAIKKTKSGKRYGFFAMLEAITPREKRKEWGLLSFDEITKWIAGISEEKKDYYTLLHFDSHYKTGNKKSFYDGIWKNPQLHEIPEYKEYLNKDQD